MAAAALLAVTLVPALMSVFVNGSIRPESKNPISRFFIWAYRPIIRGTLRHPKSVILISVAIGIASVLPVQRLLLGTTIIPFKQIGSEFMPALNEGDFFTCRQRCLACHRRRLAIFCSRPDRIIAAFPEVEACLARLVEQRPQPTLHRCQMFERR